MPIRELRTGDFIHVQAADAADFFATFLVRKNRYGKVVVEVDCPKTVTVSPVQLAVDPPKLGKKRLPKRASAR